MQKDVTFSAEVLAKFPELAVCIGTISGIRNEKENDYLAHFKKIVYEEAKAHYDVEALKDNPTVRAYRDFYWQLGIDPTKTRPSGEALLRRVLNGNESQAYQLQSTPTIWLQCKP